MLSRHQSHHVTDDAGNQQTRLLMLEISRWLHVRGAAVHHLPSILCNGCAALMARVSLSTISWTHARLTHALLACTDRIDSNSYANTQANVASAVGQPMQIGDNYLNNSHFPLHANNEITWALIPCHIGHVWHLTFTVSFPTPPAGRPPSSLTATAWVVIRGAGMDLT